MFYCDECRKRLGYPESFMASYGPCEVCGTRAVCHDTPSYRLPDPKPSEEKRK